MKQIIFMGVGVIFIVLTSIIIITLQSGSIRKTKLENAVSELMEEYMEESYENAKLRNLDEKEFEKWFKENLSMRISEDGEYEVTVEKRNMQSGILSLCVRESYKHIIGSEGKISVRNTVLKEEESLKSLNRVSFCLTKEMANEIRRPELIARYIFAQGKEIVVPNPPLIEGKRFWGWKDIKSNQTYGKEELKKIVIGFSDQTFVAVYQ